MLLLQQLASSLARCQQVQIASAAAMAAQQAQHIVHTAATTSCNSMHASAFASHQPADYATGLEHLRPQHRQEQPLQQQHQQQLKHWQQPQGLHLQALHQWPAQELHQLARRAYAAVRDPTLARSPGGTAAPKPRWPSKRPQKAQKPRFKKQFKRLGGRGLPNQLQGLKPEEALQKVRERPKLFQLHPGASYADYVREEAKWQRARLEGHFGMMPTRLLLERLKHADSEQRQPSSQELYAEATQAYPGAFKSRVHFKSVLRVLQDSGWVGFHRPKDAKPGKRAPFTIYLTPRGREAEVDAKPSRLLQEALPALSGLAWSVAAKQRDVQHSDAGV